MAADFFHAKRDEVRTQGQQLADIFQRLEPQPTSGSLTDAPLASAREKIAASFDQEFGGIGSAPKFPHPSTLDRLLRHWRAGAATDNPDVESLFMVSLTLTRMAQGGIYDQLGGGFCRYSVDRFWQIPHFEKMLYDNGPLLALYAQAALATGEPLFKRIASETADWLLEDMQAPNGGFFSTRDADSEGEEGKYYVWTPDEVEALLSADEYTPLARRFGLDQEANFEGSWHLAVRESVESIAGELGRQPDDVRQQIDAGRRRLLDARSQRVPPGRDEKQLTAWNALAIRGLAVAGRALERPELISAADAAAHFLRDTLVVDGRLFASFKDGRTRFPAYLDDHAFLIDALIELLQANWNTTHLAFAINLAELLLEHFEDSEHGGFYFTANDHETLMHRSKPLSDDATPSGNGIAAFALQRLGFLLGETRYLVAAERALKNAWQAMSEYPHGHVSLVTTLEEFLEHPEIIIIRGDEQEVHNWQASASRLYAPRRLVFAIPADAGDLPGALAERKPQQGSTIAYRCVGNHCSLPVTSWEALAVSLTETNTGDTDEQ